MRTNSLTGVQLLHGFASVMLLTTAVAAPGRPAAAPQCTLRVIARDVASKRPVPGISMIVMVRGVSQRSNRLITTDARGAASLTVPRGAVVQVYPGGPRYGGGPLLDESWIARRGAQSVTVRKNTVLVVPVKVLATRDVAVHVVDTEGKPVANAVVMAGVVTVRTGAQGRAVVKVPNDARALNVTACSPRSDGMGSATIGRTDATVTVRLRAATPLEGRVVDQDGRPVAGLRLMMVPALRNAVNRLTFVQAETDADGTFRTSLFPSVTYELYWDRQGDIKSDNAELKVTEDGKVEPIRVVRLELDPKLFEGSVCRSEATKCRRISSFELDAADNLLVCDEDGRAVLKVSPDDALLAKWNLDFAPQAIAVRHDGSMVIAGEGQIVLMGPDGTILRRGRVPGSRAVTALAAAGSEVFACLSGDAGFSIYRMKDDFTQAKRVIAGLSGCCGQMDFRIHDGHLYVAENGRFAIVKYTLEGKKVAAFVHSDSKKPDYYGDGCCEPKNICFGPNGTIYAAASSPMEVREYGKDGKFIRLVGKLPDADGSCVRVTVGVTRDGSRVYLLDTANNCVRLVPTKKQ